MADDDTPRGDDGVPTFDSYDTEPPPPKPFRLSGKTLTTSEHWSEDFQILGAAPQGALATLAGAVTIKDGAIHYTANAVVRFLRSVILPADEQRFDALINDKERMLHLEQLGDVMLWAAGMVADRPTGPLSSSDGGQRGTEPGSEADGPSQDTGPEGSTG